MSVPLDFTRFVVSAMRMVTVEFAAAVVAPLEYRVVATSEAVEWTRTVTGSGTLLRFDKPFKMGVTWSFQVTAVYADSELEGATYSLPLILETSWAAVLRQHCYDVVSVAGIMIGGRPLQFFVDKYGRPLSPNSKEATSKGHPRLEIMRPELQASRSPSGVRREEAYACAFRVEETGDDSDAALERAEVVMTRVRDALDSLPNLGLGGVLGVVQGSWDWKRSDEGQGDRVAGVEFTLTVPFPAVMIGKLPWEE